MSYILNSGSGGVTIAAETINGEVYTYGKNILGASGVSDGPVSTGNPMPASLVPTANPLGCSPYRLISASGTNDTSIKGSAGQVYGWYITNVNADEQYLKLYDATGVPTVGTDTPVMTVLIPGSINGAGAAFEMSNGIAFNSGIGLGLTGAVQDNDTTAVTSGELIINLFYK